jgi:hypothetical protein
MYCMYSMYMEGIEFMSDKIHLFTARSVFHSTLDACDDAHNMFISSPSSKSALNIGQADALIRIQ